MIKYASLAAAAAFIVGAPAAFAADMPIAQAPMEATVIESASYDWSGFYVGVYGGYAFGEFDDAFAGTGDAEGGMAGGTLGYNMQFGGNWVAGIEVDGGWAGIEDDVTGTDFNIDWTSTARGRIGYAFDNFLVYATGGAAIAGIEVDGAGAGGADDDTRLGYAVGGGVEAALTDNISGKIEYQYIDLGDEEIDTVPVDFNAHTVKAGINYRF